MRIKTTINHVQKFKYITSTILSQTIGHKLTQKEHLAMIDEQVYSIPAYQKLPKWAKASISNRLHHLKYIQDHHLIFAYKIPDEPYPILYSQASDEQKDKYIHHNGKGSVSGKSYWLDSKTVVDKSTIPATVTTTQTITNKHY